MRSLKAFLLAPIPSVLLVIAITFTPALITSDFVGGPQTLRAQLIAFLMGGLIISYAAVVVFALPIFFVLRAA